MNDIQALDSEFQERVLKAAMETEATVEQQAAQRLKAAIEEAQNATRTQVAEELQARLNQQMASAVNAARDEMSAERSKHSQEVEAFQQAKAEWELERERLLADCQRLNQLLDESRDEHNKTQSLTDEAAAIALERQVAKAVARVRAEAASRWDVERAQLIAQRDRAFQSLADLDTEHQQTLARVRSEVQTASAPSSTIRVEEPSLSADELYAEVARVEDSIQEISRIIEDPSTELSLVIRKNAERAELESYLRGLRFNIPGR
jgi:hypothetical protein